MPDALKNVKDLKSGGQFLNSIGVDKSFVGEQFNKYAGYLPKIGLDKDTATPLVDGITSQMSASDKPQQATRSTTKLDKSRFHKI